MHGGGTPLFMDEIQKQEDQLDAWKDLLKFGDVSIAKLEEMTQGPSNPIGTFVKYMYIIMFYF